MESPIYRKPGPQQSGVDSGTFLYVTPVADVDVACRCALRQFLQSQFSGEVPLILRPTVEFGDVEHPSVTSSPSDSESDLLDVWQTLHGLKVLDPACGEGHFLLGMLRVLSEAKAVVGRQILTHKEANIRDAGQHNDVSVDDEVIKRRLLANNLYGVEVERERLESAKSLLHRDVGLPDVQAASQDKTHLICSDAFSFSPFRSTWSDVQRKGGFDIVIGNPPFVRHELIRDPLAASPPSQYKDKIERVIYRRFPRFFDWNEQRATALHPLDRRSDLAALFTLLGLSLTHPGGVLAFIVPKALLQARYGLQLKEALAHEAEVTLWERSDQRSFRAGVNTVTLMAVRRESAASPKSPMDWTPRVVGNHRLPAHSIAPHLLGKMSSIVTLGSMGRLRYPVKTGVNDFFYPTRQVIEKFGIEPQFLKPVLRSPRTVRRIRVDADELGPLLFHCSESIDVLKDQDFEGAVAYIRWGAEQRTSRGMRWPSVPSVKSRKLWYSITLPEPAHIICPRFFDRRFFFLRPNSDLIEDQTFYGLVLPNGGGRLQDTLAAILNSSIVYLLLETFGRTGLGEGVRQYALCDFSSLPIPDPRVLRKDCIRELENSFERVCSRIILPVDEEMREEDRHRLDGVVGKAFGLKERDLESARDALRDLISMRVLRARNILDA